MQNRRPLIIFIMFCFCFSSLGALERISVENGRFVYPNGNEVTLWGVNFQPSLGWEYERFVKAGLIERGTFDEASYYKIIDEGLSEIQQLGCDVIRVTLSPHELAYFDGSLKDSPNMRILDYLTSMCRQREIYYYFAFINELGANNKNVKGSLMEDINEGGKINYYDWLLDPDFIRRSQEYIRNLFVRENLYDGVRMIDDPAFCIAELINEPHTPELDDPEAPFHKIYSLWLQDRGVTNTADNFQLWRKDYTLKYINEMCDFFAELGCQAPVAWSHKWSMAIRHNGGDAEWQASLDSKVPAVCFSTYPTQGTVYDYVRDAKKDLRKLGREYNSLPYLQESYDQRELQGWANEPAFRDKAHYVYEWETHANMTSYMYPAMAKYFRAQGAQIATMWTYILPKLSNYIAAQHLLNLKSTPGKSASFLAAGEVFRNTPLYMPYKSSGIDEDYFNNTATDFKEGTSAYADDVSLIYSGDMPQRYVDHLLSAARLRDGFRRIVGVGNSPFVRYDGTGLYFVDLNESGGATIKILPDCEWLRSPQTGGKMLQENGEAPEEDDPPYASAREYYEIARKNRTLLSNKYISDIEHKMEIMAPNLAEYVQIFRVEETELIPINLLTAKPPSFMAKPGTYLIEPTL
ncbi:MAG: hypothetical protein VXZ83_03195 [Verrucomicrobiota bacterium]|nr:hypothetical protein [Verrucomicrobiota bacterium]